MTLVIPNFGPTEEALDVLKASPKLHPTLPEFFLQAAFHLGLSDINMSTLQETLLCQFYDQMRPEPYPWPYRVALRTVYQVWYALESESIQNGPQLTQLRKSPIVGT